MRACVRVCVWYFAIGKPVKKHCAVVVHYLPDSTITRSLLLSHSAWAVCHEVQTGAKPQKKTAYVTDGHDRAIVSTRQSTTSPVGREFPMDGAEGQDIYHSCLLNHREDSSLHIDWNDKSGLYHFDDRFRSKSRCLKLRPSVLVCYRKAHRSLGTVY